jgi:phage gp36-like protein
LRRVTAARFIALAALVRANAGEGLSAVLMYHTYADLLARMSERDILDLVDDERLGVIVQSPPNAPYQRVLDLGASVAGIIDGYCRGRYTVPFETTPDIIKEVSVDLHIHALYKRRKDLQDSDEQQSRYRNAVRLLEHIQQGKIRLFDEVASPPNYSTNKETTDRVFDSDTLSQF